MIIGTVESCFIFWRQWCTSALLMAITTVPIQRLFISANFWWLLALLKILFFWRQCCTSALLSVSTTAPKRLLFKNAIFWWFQALLIILLFSGGNVVLRRCWWLVHQDRKNVIQQCQIMMIFGHCLIFLLFSGVNVVLGASGGWYYSAETKVVH